MNLNLKMNNTHNLQFNPVNFMEVTGFLTNRQLRLATQIIRTHPDGQTSAIYADCILRDNPDIRDCPRTRDVSRQPACDEMSRVVDFSRVPVEEETLIGAQYTATVFDPVGKNGESRKLRDRFISRITAENTAFVQVHVKPTDASPHRNSEIEWYPKNSARLIDVMIKP